MSDVGLLISQPTCEWHACRNTANVERNATFKVKGENVYRHRKVHFCFTHDQVARRTGRMSLRDHPDALDNPAAQA